MSQMSLEGSQVSHIVSLHSYDGSDEQNHSIIH